MNARKNNIKSTDYLSSFAKGLKIIECFSHDNQALSITQAAKLSGLDRAVARRSLLTLYAEKYADYDGKFFSLTPKALRLGMGALASMSLTNLVQPWLEQLSELTQESFSVSILDQTEIVYIARAAQRKVFSINLHPGSRLPAYCTSMGRVLLAYLPEDESSKIVQLSSLTSRTIHTLTGSKAILAELVKVKEQGYSLVDQEMELGLSSLAVPLRTMSGSCVAALNVGVCSSVYSNEVLLSDFLPKLLVAQSSIQKILYQDLTFTK